MEYSRYFPITLLGPRIPSSSKYKWRRRIYSIIFCLNIPTVDSIVTRVRSYGGVQRVELFIITSVAYHEEWLVREINKKLRSYSKTKIGLPAIK
jgi:hypothetical protein